MLQSRGIYGPPPPPQTKQDNHPTLLFSWWCTGMAVTIICFRIFGRLVRNNQLFREDKIMLLSAVPLLVRMGLVHVVLTWGTNNVDTSGGLDEIDIYHRSIGSKVVLGARVSYALFIWTAKFTVSEFLKRLTSNYWKRHYEVALHFIRIFLVATFLAVLVATLAECQPFSHYWQVIPDPGPQCRSGVVQLITMGTADILTDILLIILPLLIILKSSMPLKRKFSLCLLFSLSSILIAITATRIPKVISKRSRQQYRSVYASAEILAAAAVSNAVILGSFLRDRGVKRQKYKFSVGSASVEAAGPSSRRLTMTKQALGSDEDLFAGMCYRSSHEGDLEGALLPRPAPTFGPVERPAFLAPDYSPQRSTSGREGKAVQQAPKSPTGVTFEDPGGLLSPSEQSPSNQGSMLMEGPGSPKRT